MSVSRLMLTGALQIAAAASLLHTADSAAAGARTSAEILAASQASDWRPLDAGRTIYLELPQSRVVIELAPEFAPRAAANIVALSRAHFYDGLSITRVQDNYVVQWGDAQSTRPRGAALAKLPAEFTRSDTGLHFTALRDPDSYAPQTGFVQDFPAARDPVSSTAWLTHCYGAVGVGRDNDPASGDGRELYVVIGQAPRHLDRNITVVGRVLQGIERLASLPRGTGEMGAYVQTAERVPIRAMRVASDLPEAERTALEVLRTDTPLFDAWVESRRTRAESWFVVPAGRIDVCNLSVPVRERARPDR